MCVDLLKEGGFHKDYLINIFGVLQSLDNLEGLSFIRPLRLEWQSKKKTFTSTDVIIEVNSTFTNMREEKLIKVFKVSS